MSSKEAPEADVTLNYYIIVFVFIILMIFIFLFTIIIYQILT